MPVPEGVSEKKYDSCVDDIKAKGEGEGKNPYAICAASLKKESNEMIKFYKNGQWNIEKSNVPHPPKSADDSAHDIVEEHSMFDKEMNGLTSDEKKELMRHLRTLRDPKNRRDPNNREIGRD